MELLQVCNSHQKLPEVLKYIKYYLSKTRNCCVSPVLLKVLKIGKKCFQSCNMRFVSTILEIITSQLHETLALHSLNTGSEYYGLLKRQEKMSFEFLEIHKARH